MIKIGIAGTRGLSTLMGLKAIEDVQIAAMCDLDEAHLNEAAEKIGGDIKKYRVFDDMIESDIDAVIISTPMQCHVPQAIAALEAGKHVMSEVTAGVTIDELFWLTEVVEKYGKIYMYGENYIYDPRVQQIKEMVKQGVFGDTYYAEGMYLHNIGNLFVYPNGKTSWRSFWQCGIRGNFYPTHSVGPVMQWFPGERITEISTYSPGIYNELGLKQDSGTTTMCKTATGKLLQIRVDCMSPRPHCMDYYHLQGTKGCFNSRSHKDDIDRVSFIGEDSPLHEMKWQKLDNFEIYMPDRYKNATQEQKAAGHNGGDFFIVEDFINAIRDNKQPELDVYKACEWTAVGLLSSLSVTNGSRTMQMPDFRKNMPVEEKRITL
ncbi:MAG: Gfo/Idh/MocA family oxidoreductase [Clostridiales bacterium]|nr:Gfo/Idh/MocA family oxidoreductase [Clostridiales bacterium]